jgi:hypothetical protein
MRQGLRATGASAGQIAISVDEIGWHRVLNFAPFCFCRLQSRKKLENARGAIKLIVDLGSKKAKPTASPALKNRLF